MILVRFFISLLVSDFQNSHTSSMSSSREVNGFIDWVQTPNLNGHDFEPIPDGFKLDLKIKLKPVLSMWLNFFNLAFWFLKVNREDENISGNSRKKISES